MKEKIQEVLGYIAQYQNGVLGWGSVNRLQTNSMFSFTLQDALERYADSLLTLLGSVEAAQKKVQKLKTVLFQVLYAVMGQPSHSRKQNQAFLARISVAGFIESYDALVIEQIGKLKAEKDKSADAYLSSWKDFIRWLGSQPDYVSSASSNVSAVVEEPVVSFFLKAPHGKGVQSNLLPINPKPSIAKFCLKEEDLTPYWKTKLKELEIFCNIISPEEEDRLYQGGRRKQKKDGMRRVTFDMYKTDLLLYLGWATRFACNPETGKPYMLEELTIERVYSLELLQENITWQLEVRRNSYGRATKTCNIGIKLAQFDLHQPIGITRNLAHPTVKALMDLKSQYSPKKGEHPLTSTGALERRLLDYPQCVDIVKYYRQRAKFLQQEWEAGRLKKREQMEDAWQDYLLIALLTFNSMRAREIREMAFDHQRLVFDETKNEFWCHLRSSQHKNSGKRPYPLFPGALKDVLTKDFAEYFNDIRPNWGHRFVFFQRVNSKNGLRGKPVKGDFNRLTKTITYSGSRELFGQENAKAMTPHDFRRCLATYFVHYGDRNDTPVIAAQLGHSEEMLRNVYAQVDNEKLTQRSSEVWNRVNAKAQSARQSGTNEHIDVFLSKRIAALSLEQKMKLRTLMEQGII